MNYSAKGRHFCVARFELYLNKARDAPPSEELAFAFSIITIDWPGFGDLPRPETMKRLFLVQTVPFVFPILEPSGVSATIKRLDARGTRDKRAPHIRDLIS
jgi:hypothetical protein